MPLNCVLQSKVVKRKAGVRSTLSAEARRSPVG